jgi:hypothetical protein
MTDRIRTLLLTAAALAPCVAAFGVAACPATTASSPVREMQPPLAFNQYGVSLGEIGPQPAVEAHFAFRNRGERPVTIDDVGLSCGCVRWALHGNQKTYQPGEYGRLILTLQTANEDPGPHHYTVEVASNDGQTRRDSLSFRVTLPDRKVAVEPHEVFFYQLHGQADERIIHVADDRDGAAPLDVISASCTSQQVAVEVLPATKDERGRRRVPVRLKVPANVRAGREIAHVIIATSDPDYSRLAVPVLIQGPQPKYGLGPAERNNPEIWKLIQGEAKGVEQTSGRVLTDDDEAH